MTHVDKSERIKVGLAMRDRRKASRMSQALLARLAGLTERTIGDIERAEGAGDRSLAPVTQQGIADALGLVGDWADRAAAGDEPETLMAASGPVRHPIADPIIRARFEDLERRLAELEDIVAEQRGGDRQDDAEVDAGELRRLGRAVSPSS